MARGKNPTVNRACGPGTAGREEGRALKGQGAWLRAPQQGELQRLKGLWGVWALQEGGISVPQSGGDYCWDEPNAGSKRSIDNKTNKRPKLPGDNQNAHVLIKLRKRISEKSLPFQLWGNSALTETFLFKKRWFSFSCCSHDNHLSPNLWYSFNIYLFILLVILSSAWFSLLLEQGIQ